MPDSRGRHTVDDLYRPEDADAPDDGAVTPSTEVPAPEVPTAEVPTAEVPAPEVHRTWDPLTDPLDPADLLPLDEPGDPSLWERDLHPRDAITWEEFSTDAEPTPGPQDIGPPQSPNGSSAHHGDEPTGAAVTPQPFGGVTDQNPDPDVQPGGPAPADPRAPVSEAVQNTVTDRIPRTPEPAVAAVGLQKRFGDFVAVSDVTFSVAKGTILGLLGPNGAGKTTTVNMLCTLLKPDAGTGLVAGHDVVHQAAAVRRSIMLTGQFAALDESLTGRENLILFGRLLGLAKPAATVRADELLAAFGLTDAARRRVREYSGGMRRRIDIACGLVTRPEVVFLDEPTTGLDPRSRQEVWQLVKSLRNQGVTTVLTTQYLEEADELADQIVVIDHGRVIARGTTDELKSQIGTSVYQVTPTDPEQVPAVREALADLLAESPSPVQSALTPSLDAPARDGDRPISVSVPAPDGADTLVQIVQRTSAAGIRLSDVALRRPSLDEVFLALTEPSTTKVPVP